jgi:hypothetical protein
LKPTLQNISDPEQALKWTIFHTVLGVTSAFTPWGFILYFYAVLYFNFGASIKALTKGGILLFTLLLGYLQGFEQIAKVSRTFPFVPSEYAKYISIIFTLIALFVNKKQSNGLGIALLVLIMPAIFYDRSGERGWAEVVNHFLSPLAVALGVMLWGGYRPTDQSISRLMRVIWFGLLTVLVAVYIRTPDYDSLDFNLEANRSTAGGGSTNQVSTALGFGMFLTFFALYKRQKFSGYRLLDIGILGLFALQTLLTFSRGGMFGSIIAIATLIGASMLTKQKSADQSANKKKNLAILYLAAGVVILYLVFNIVDNITGGKLTQRYQGETAGTAGGYAEKDLNRMTSGRSGIIEEDLEVWQEYPLLGSGIGASPYLRMKYQTGDLFYITPHIEISRLLAEHGLLGLAYFIILMYLGWRIWVRRNKIPSSDVIFALYILAFISSFHSAMRTFVTPFLLSVCAMSLSKPEPKRA